MNYHCIYIFHLKSGIFPIIIQEFYLQLQSNTVKPWHHTPLYTTTLYCAQEALRIVSTSYTDKFMDYKIIKKLHTTFYDKK
jgi:hypothetical protein